MSKRTSNSYTEEFKQSSAKLAATSDQSITKTSEELGININTLYGWVTKYEPNSLNRQKVSHAEDALSEELKQLRKENKRLRQERDILKKAAAYFAVEIM